MKLKALADLHYATDGIGHKTKRVRKGDTVEFPDDNSWAVGLLDCGLAERVEEKKITTAPENKAIKKAPANKKKSAKKKTPKKKAK